jgi:hypothetical protein
VFTSSKQELFLTHCPVSYNYSLAQLHEGLREKSHAHASVRLSETSTRIMTKCGAEDGGRAGREVLSVACSFGPFWPTDISIIIHFKKTFYQVSRKDFIVFYLL